MNKWVIGIIAPVILGLILEFFKATNPIYLATLFGLSIILPILLIMTFIEWNKHTKERESK